MTKGAFNELEEFTDFKQPFPREGFFIKKYFLNRELSYFVVVEMNHEDAKNEKTICLAQTIIRDKKTVIRKIHNKYFKAK